MLINRLVIVVPVLLFSHILCAASSYPTQRIVCHDQDEAAINVTTRKYPGALNVGGVTMSLFSTTNMFSGKIIHIYSIDFTDMWATETEQDGHVVIMMPNGIERETITCFFPEYHSRTPVVMSVQK